MLRKENVMKTRKFEVTFPDTLDAEYISNLVQSFVMDIGPDILIKDITEAAENE